MVWSPLAGGLLSGKFGPGTASPNDSRRTTFDFPPVNKDRAWECVAVMREIGAAHGVSVARVALAWLLSKRHVMSVIIGAKSVEQLDDNLAAVDLALSVDDISRLDAGPLLLDLDMDFAPMAARRGLDFKVLPTSVHVLTDPVMLNRILQNLVGNA
eukprot:gene66635-biopygen48921